jgi:hypothetical protein
VAMIPAVYTQLRCSVFGRVVHVIRTSTDPFVSVFPIVGIVACMFGDKGTARTLSTRILCSSATLKSTSSLLITFVVHHCFVRGKN